MSSCNSVSQDVEERPIDDDLVGRNSWRGTFFLFPLVCDMGLFFSLSLSLFYNATQLESDSERRIRHADTPFKQ